MDHAYSILMFCFAGALLVYAGLLALCGPELIPRYRLVYGKKMSKKDGKALARRVAKIVAITAAAPLLSGVVWLITGPDGPLFPAMLALVGGFAVCIWLGVRVTKE